MFVNAVIELLTIDFADSSLKANEINNCLKLFKLIQNFTTLSNPGG